MRPKKATAYHVHITDKEDAPTTKCFRTKKEAMKYEYRLWETNESARGGIDIEKYLCTNIEKQKWLKVTTIRTGGAWYSKGKRRKFKFGEVKVTYAKRAGRYEEFSGKTVSVNQTRRYVRYPYSDYYFDSLYHNKFIKEKYYRQKPKM